MILDQKMHLLWGGKLERWCSRSDSGPVFPLPHIHMDTHTYMHVHTHAHTDIDTHTHGDTHALSHTHNLNTCTEFLTGSCCWEPVYGGLGACRSDTNHEAACCTPELNSGAVTGMKDMRGCSRKKKQVQFWACKW